LPQQAKESQNGHSAAKKRPSRDKCSIKIELITNTFQLKRKQKQKFKASPRDGSESVQVATMSPRISKMSQQSQKKTSRGEWGIKLELTSSAFQLKKRQKQKSNASPRYGGPNVQVAMTSPRISKM
jgi:hypothetical protein